MKIDQELKILLKKPNKDKSDKAKIIKWAKSYNLRDSVRKFLDVIEKS